MVRIPRIHIEGALFYVTSRGDNDRDIFKDKEDYFAYADLLRKYKEQYGFKLFAYCFLPNHLHLLLELKESLTVSNIMHDLNANYTKYFNARYERKGHLFQERYKMIIMDKDTYILPVMTYIHLNPLALGLVKELKEYPYGSYLYYIRETGQTLPIEQEAVPIQMQEELKEVRARVSEFAVADYASYLKGVAKEEMERLGKRLTRSTILGPQEFLEKIKRLAEELSASNKQEVEEFSTPLLQHRFIQVSLVVIAVLGIFSLYLFASSLGLKKSFKQELEQKKAELETRLKEEKAKLAQDLQERYAADMVSYEAMARRMEMEKKKAAELEQEVQKLKEQSPKAKTTKGAQK